MSSRGAAPLVGPEHGKRGKGATSLVESGRGASDRAADVLVESGRGVDGLGAGLLVEAGRRVSGSVKAERRSVSGRGAVVLVEAEPGPVNGRVAGVTATASRGHPSRTVQDRGSISLLMVAIGIVFVVALVAGIGLGGARVARHRAQNAADAGALAGAVWAIDGPLAACAVAGRVVSANNARLVSCSVDGLDVRVTVEARLTDSTPARRASARAGPVRDTSAGAEPGD